MRIELFTTDGPGVSRCILQQRENVVSCCTFTADRECCFMLYLYSRQRVLFHAVPTVKGGKSVGGNKNAVLTP